MQTYDRSNAGESDVEQTRFNSTMANNRTARTCITMMRIPGLLALSVLCLAGCFVFNNLYDKTPAATFEIVVSSTNYGGTYVWNSQDYAYEATVGGTRYYVYIDSSNYWCLANQLNQTYNSGSIAHSISKFGTLPPTSGLGWSSTITGIDDSVGGVSVQGGAPDGGIPGGTLQVSFLASNPGNSATYQWQRSSTSEQSSSYSPINGGNSSTYLLQPGPGNDYQHWVRVTIMPTDSTGTIQGIAVVSQPVFWP